MVSSVIYIGLGLEAGCRFLCLSISGTAEFGSKSGTHSQMNSTHTKESQLVQITELPSVIAMDIFRVLFVDDMAICLGAHLTP